VVTVPLFRKDVTARSQDLHLLNLEHGGLNPTNIFKLHRGSFTTSADQQWNLKEGEESVVNENEGEEQIMETQHKIVELIDEGEMDMRQAVSCEHCDRRFISENFLRKHKKDFHTDSSTFAFDLETDLISTSFESSTNNFESADPHFDPLNTSSIDPMDTSSVDPMDGYREVTEVDIDKVDSLLEIGEHIEIHESSVSYTCDICDQVVVSKAQLTKHKKSEHNIKLKFECPQCDKCYSSEQSLKQHRSSVHDGISSICYICLKAVVDITRHIRLQHTKKEERKFACKVCEKSFRTLFAMSRHTEMVHLKLRPWPCDLCEKSFGSKRDVERHRKYLHLRQSGGGRRIWTCPLCREDFKKRTLYDMHKAGVHANCNEMELLSFLSYELKSKGEAATHIILGK